MRNNKKVCYTSSYDRGLEHLLKMWPEIKREVPDAQLVIAYGWQLFVKFYADNPSSMGWKARMDEMMKADGITHLDRLPQDKLKEVMETCGIWSYPTHFGEISCISAMKAQCYGAIPVVVNYAALQTTVQYGVKVDGDIYDKETQEEYKKQLIALLKDDNRQEEIREPMIKWAKDTFSWSKVASDWTKEFHGN
jgi:glycosyltransferase involved in cell wall biosynthesis